MKQWFCAAELAGLQGVPGTKSAVIRRAKKDRWQSQPRAGRGGGREYSLTSLPATTQAELLIKHQSSLSPPNSSGASRPSHRAVAISSQPGQPPACEASYIAEEIWNRYARLPDKTKDEAKRRLKFCQAVAALIDHGQKVTEALDITAEHGQVARATLARWWYSLDGIRRCDWMAWLAPRYAGRAPDAECSPEAWDYFKADWLRLESPAAEACYERLCRAAKSHGWQVPALRTLQRRIEREIPRPVVIMARRGIEAFHRTMPAQERDHAVFRALEAVNADGHKFDVFVRWPNGVVGRPLMLAWQDIHSGKLLSYRVDQTEHSGLVRLSFGDLVESYGIPDHAWLDNGRGFAAKLITGGIATRYRFKVREEDPDGILKNMDVQVHWASPYHGQAKPIERAFRDLCEYVAKHPAFAGAYVGNNPTAKPENYGSRAIPIDEFMRVLETEIRAHNARTGRTSTVCAGRSFDEAFNESYARSTPRKPTSEQRRLWLLAAEGKKLAASDGSLHLMGNRYWSEQLAENAGLSIIARFDPDALHAGVHVYALDGRYLCHAECVLPVGFNDSQAARIHAHAKSSRKRAHKQLLAAERRLSATEAAQLLPEMQAAEIPQAKVVRLVPRSNGSAAVQLTAEELIAEMPMQNNEQRFIDAVKKASVAWERQMSDRLE